jgi:hypothetical protein
MNAAQPLRWLMAEQPAGHETPEWIRSACLDACGTVFAPAALTDSEAKALLAASWDDHVTLVESEGHIFLPVQWLAAYSPADAALFLLIERRTRAHFAQELKP